jgi:hypothetical protein
MHSRLLATVSAIAVFGALGYAPSATAVAVVSACPGQSTVAVQSSVVPSTVILGSPNTYLFEVCNTSPDPGSEEGGVAFLLRDWELPYDPLAGIANITAPSGWAWAIETVGTPTPDTGWDGAPPEWWNPSDPFYDPRYLDLTQVIHFYTCGQPSACYGDNPSVNGSPLQPGEGLAGFSFTSPFAATNSPYQASWVFEPVRSGDPAFPLAGGPNSPGLRSIPEPGGLALFALGLGALLAARARRRRDETG